MSGIEASPYETELRIFWMAANELADARRKRLSVAVRYATQDLQAIAMHTTRPVLRNAALRLLAS